MRYQFCTKILQLLKKISLIVFLFVCQNYFGQELSLKIISTTTIENDLIDSIGYQKKHSNTKNLTAEVKRFSNQLIELGYLENEIINSIKLADTLYQFTANLGTQI